MGPRLRAAMTIGVLGLAATAAGCGGGNDGPDDAAENLLNWTMLHALGA